MESAPLGLVLDSSTMIRAERSQQSITDFIEAILQAHGPLELSLSPVTVAELVHGIYRAKTPEAARRIVHTSKNWSTLFRSIRRLRRPPGRQARSKSRRRERKHATI
jgi:predicted nucleic acid-binding protein